MRRTRNSMLVVGIVVLVALMVSGCTENAAGATGGATTSAGATTLRDHLTLVAFGDSWPNGGHCDGCVAFPARYADGLEQATGLPVRFIDHTESLTKDGREVTPETLLDELRHDHQIRAHTMKADVIMIATGPNDLDNGTLTAYEAGTCGGPDNTACFKTLGPSWRASFDAILDEIATLRDGKPTAIRLVTADNFFISDPGLIEEFGRRFGRTTGAQILDDLATAICGAAQAHDAVCIDAQTIINGPGHHRPQDENSEKSHQGIADALVASGLAELGL